MKREYLFCILAIMHPIFLCFPSPLFSNVEPLLWVEAFKSVEKSVQSLYSNCESADIVFDNKFSSSFDLIVSAWNDQMKSSDAHQDTILIIDLDGTANDSRIVECKRHFSARYRTPCSLALYQMDLEFGGNNFLVRPKIGDWPDGIAVLAPSLSTRTFFVFYTHYNWPPEYVNQISNFTSLILHSIFAIPQVAGGINFYRAFPQIQAPLAPLGTFDKTSKSEDFSKVLLFGDYNFEGEPLITLTCLMCVPNAIAESTLFGALNEALAKFNATLEVEEVFGIPGRGYNEDGELDDFVRPLVVGPEAAFCTVAILSDTLSKILYLTHTHLHDGANFISRMPKKMKIKSFTIIQAPLDKIVWVAILVSAVSLFSFLKMVSYWKEYSTSSGTILDVIMKPIVEQMSVSEHLGSYLMIKEESVVKVVLGIWFLSLIVLVCIYKCILVSVVVIPQYDTPPRNYKELVESDYDVGAIFYTTTLQGYMIASNSSVSLNLMSRIVEYNYIEPECYSMVLKGRKVCLGYSSALLSIGSRFTVDVHGRSLIMVSKDAYYFTMVCIGVSKYYPMFTEPLDLFMKLWNAGRVGKLYDVYAKFRDSRAGKKFALENVDSMPVYLGEDYDDDESSDAKRIAYIAAEILFWGFILSVCILIVEISWKGKGYWGWNGSFFPGLLRASKLGLLGTGKLGMLGTGKLGLLGAGKLALLGTRVLRSRTKMAAGDRILMPVRPTWSRTKTVWAQDSIPGYSDYNFRW